MLLLSGVLDMTPFTLGVFSKSNESHNDVQRQSCGKLPQHRGGLEDDVNHQNRPKFPKFPNY